MWHGPYVVKCVLEKGTYELVDYEGTALVEPKNGLYLKKYCHIPMPPTSKEDATTSFKHPPKSPMNMCIHKIAKT